MDISPLHVRSASNPTPQQQIPYLGKTVQNYRTLAVPPSQSPTQSLPLPGFNFPSTGKRSAVEMQSRETSPLMFGDQQRRSGRDIYSHGQGQLPNGSSMLDRMMSSESSRGGDHSRTKHFPSPITIPTRLGEDYFTAVGTELGHNRRANGSGSNSSQMLDVDMEDRDHVGMRRSSDGSLEERRSSTDDLSTIGDGDERERETIGGVRSRKRSRPSTSAIPYDKSLRSPRSPNRLAADSSTSTITAATPVSPRKLKLTLGPPSSAGSTKSKHSNPTSPIESTTSRQGVAAAAGSGYPSPEHLFFLLKGSRWTGELESVGLEGPKNLHAVLKRGKADTLMAVSGKGNKQDIWTDEAELVFLAAEVYLPPTVNAKVMFFQKACGRNEIIALVISMCTGRLISRKQVSSHLQVVRQRKSLHNEVKAVFDRVARESELNNSTSGVIPNFTGVDLRLYQMMGVDPQVDLSSVPKPDWIARLEAQHPSAEYGNKKPVRYWGVDVDDPHAESTVKQSPGSSHRELSPLALAVSPPRAMKKTPVARKPSREETALVTRKNINNNNNNNNNNNQGLVVPAPVMPTRSYGYSWNEGQYTGESDTESSDTDEDEEEVVTSATTPQSVALGYGGSSLSPSSHSFSGLHFSQLGLHSPRKTQFLPTVPTMESRLSQQRQRPSLHLTYVNFSLDNGSSIASLAVESTQDMPTRKFSSIPMAETRFSKLRDLHNEVACEILHVELSLNCDMLLSNPTDVSISIGLSTLVRPFGASFDYQLVSSSGYGLGPGNEEENIYHCSQLHGAYEHNRPGSVAYRTESIYNDNILPILVTDAEDNLEELLPQYWVMQEIAIRGTQVGHLNGKNIFSGSSLSPAYDVSEDIPLVIIYSLRGGQRRRARVERVVFENEARKERRMSNERQESMHA